jgi:hypothetical protein
MRSSLPDVPERIVRSANEDLNAAIRVDSDGWDVSEKAAERTPCRPGAGVRRILPDVPERSVSAYPEELETSIDVAASGDSATECGGNG